MEHTLHTPECYDFRRYDRIWQRVAPTLEPYPEQHDCPEQHAQPTPDTSTAMIPRQEAQLPGAQTDPCCMGSAAREMLSVLTAYIEDELYSRAQTLALLRCAPAWARQTLRTIADDGGNHAKRLMTLYYLITGECFHPALACNDGAQLRWCPALRRRYHEKSCTALNYARSADETTDVCLQRIFAQLSAEEYHHADLLAALLERSLR